MDQKNVYKKYICLSCGYIYDEEMGDIETGIKPGTLFTELPDDWKCPDCGAEKSEFEEISFDEEEDEEDDVEE